VPAWSLSSDQGALVLEERVRKAKHLQELDYQAAVLERQARIAKAQKLIDQATGINLVPDSNQPLNTPPKQNFRSEMPLVQEISSQHVGLIYKDKPVQFFSIGDQLPSGHIIESISMNNGVVIRKNNQTSQLHYSWGR